MTRGESAVLEDRRTRERHGVLCDVATGVRFDAIGELATFGAIPPDVIAVRTTVADRIHDKALEALKVACKDHTSLVEAVFNGSELQEGLAPGYDSLKKAIEMAQTRGIFGDGE